MRVLVTGAAGFIGSHMVRALRAAGYEVLVQARDERRITRLFPDLHRVVLDYAEASSPAAWQAHLAGVDIVLNTVGVLRGRGGAHAAAHESGAIALFEACADPATVRRVIQISALGTAAGRGSYFESKRRVDEALVRVAEAHGFDWLVLRPSLVIGRGGASTALFAALAAGPVLPRIGSGTTQVQPIAIADLAECVVRLAGREDPIRAVLEAAGPEPVSTDTLLVSFRRWLGWRPAPFVPVPWPVLQVAGWCGDLLGRGPVTTESMAMLRAGNTGDPGPLTTVTAVRAAPLTQALAAMPADRSDRQAARLYFLGVPLRWSLAALWIWTGIVSLGLYPTAESYALLAAAGLGAQLAPIALYGAAALDLLLGLLLLVGWRVALVGAAQLALMLAYTVIISWAMPELWLEPFGPVAKNVPIAAATLVVMALEG